MFRSIRWIVSIVLINFAPVAVAEEGPLRTIAISGMGEVSAPPDMATVQLGVRVDAKTEAAALDEASFRTNAILETLDLLGVTDTDIQTGSVRLMPRYGQSALGRTDYSKIEGYTASNSVTVKLHDLNAVGDVLAQSVGAGANTVDGIWFGLQNEDDVRDDARRKSVEEAMRLATLYADTAGMRLGTVISITDGSVNLGGGRGGYAPEAMQMSWSRDAPQLAVPVAPGEITLNAHISMVFELLELDAD